MRITVSVHAGTRQEPDEAAHLGQPIFSPAGLLGLLKAQSGTPVVSSERVAGYLVALQLVTSDKRFIHRSLRAADEMGTAQELLRWRDEWTPVDWEGCSKLAWLKRLVEMAAIEAANRGQVALDEGNRRRRWIRSTRSPCRGRPTGQAGRPNRRCRSRHAEGRGRTIFLDRKANLRGVGIDDAVAHKYCGRLDECARAIATTSGEAVLRRWPSPLGRCRPYRSLRPDRRTRRASRAAPVHSRLGSHF
jgi:hypothetical protein